MGSHRLYLAVSVEEFVQWLTEHGQPWGNRPALAGSPIVFSLKFQQHTVLGQYLGIDLAAEDNLAHDSTLSPAAPLHFTLFPVGCGERIEVHAVCDQPTLEPVLDRLVVEAAQQWAQDSADLDPGGYHRLKQLLIEADSANFTASLREWATYYQDEVVRNVSLATGLTRAPVVPCVVHPALPAPLADLPGQVWPVTLRLQSSGSHWAGIQELRLELHLAERTPGPGLLLAMTQSGFRYREAQPFVEALAMWCRRTWKTVSLNPRVGADCPPTSQVDGRQARAGQNRDLFGRLPWETIPDHLWDRPALRAWWEGRSCPEIGRDIHQSAKTVLNRLCTLRKSYGTAIVPTNHQRLEKGIRLRLSGW